MKNIRIDLGCGKSKHEGCNTFLDIADHGHNITCNFEFDKLPFKDNSVEYIWSSHVLEHIKEPMNILNECWRILKPDGKFEIKVPYGLWRGASKPVHYQCITACWFDWFRREDIYEWYGYRGWLIDKLEEIENPKTKEVYEVYCLMSPNKK